MEALEELMNDAHIIKGKRTKRQRLQSPIPFSIAAYDSPSEEFAESANTEEEEEEDMVANCLILLAQGGGSVDLIKSSKKPAGNCNLNSGSATAIPAGGFRYTSKRFLEAPSTTTGKVGMYVYQCKTCDRTFPSFQALGGHRASHKRPKPAPAPAPIEVKRKMLLLTDDDEGEGEAGEMKEDHVSLSLAAEPGLRLSSTLSLRLVNNRPSNGNNPKSSPSSKVHECSICGAEFVSGQALGGHMRRHRIPGGTNTILSLSPSSPIGCEYEDREAKKQRTLSSLSPIGGEYEDREAKKQRNVSSLSPIGGEYEDRESKKQRKLMSLSPIGGDYEDRESKKQRNVLSLSPNGGEPEDQESKKQRIVLSLDLDLNLPALPEDHAGESKFAFASKEQQQQQQQQPPLVLSTGPALVDCQY